MISMSAVLAAVAVAVVGLLFLYGLFKFIEWLVLR